MGTRSKITLAKRREAASKDLKAAFRSLQYSGPIPMSSEMEKYESLCPGATDRILKIAEKSLAQSMKQAQHRQDIEAIAVRAASERSLLGVKYAYRIAMGALALSGLCFYLDKTAAGGWIFGTALASIVGAFIYGTRSNRQERQVKWEKALQAKNEFSRR